jgi:23S rRNA (cytosine1962-C5)-methyltransferase
MTPRQLATRLVPTLFEDDHYLIARKPAGLCVRAPQSSRLDGALELLEELGHRPTTGKLAPCFMTDKYASGLIVFAKTTLSLKHLQEMIKVGKLSRTYVAVVRGKPKAPGRPKSTKDRTAPNKKARAPQHSANKGIEIIGRYAQRALVRCPATRRSGRQLRADLHKSRLPVVGDPQFDTRTRGRTGARLYLHLERVEFEHPFTRKIVQISSPTPASFGAIAKGEDGVHDQLESALAGRAPCLLDTKTNCFRLVSGKADGISGLIADKLGDVVIASVQQGKFQGGDARLQRAAEWFKRRLDVRAVYAKTIPRDRSGATEAAKRAHDPKPLIGKPGDAELIVRENSLRFIIKPHDGYLSGLFLDQRDNRSRVRSLAKGKRVLNTFAYTCGFSVSAAAGGAAHTASVDVSKKSLEWGKANFAANKIPLDKHKFYCSDVFEYFKRAERQKHKYDLIILDPPTFARSKKPVRVFSVRTDMKRLIAESLRLLDRDGMMLISTNERSLPQVWLREQVSAAARGRSFRVTESPDAPIDLTSDPDAAKAIFVQFV